MVAPSPDREHGPARADPAPDPRRATAWLAFAHVAIVAWVFAGPLFEGRLPYFRDVSTYYYPNYVFLERSIHQGVWPLINPATDAGARILFVDPVDVAMVAAIGAEGALRFGPPLHMLLAMLGASALASTVGQGFWGRLMSGAAFGLGGFYLSTLNLLELNHGASWAPWVVTAFLRVLEQPAPGRAALFAVLAALQICTLAAEVLVQTAVFGLALVVLRPTRRATLLLGAAMAVAICLAAPALLGVWALIAGSQRAAGFSADVALGWSASLPVLMDMWLPHFFGDVHTFTDAGYWGQSFFPDGFPYLLSLYTGFGAFIAAAQGRHGSRGYRLLALAMLGIVMSMGRFGPAGPLVAWLMQSFRTPMKFLFLSALSFALLAGWGVERARNHLGRTPRVALLPGLALLIGGVALIPFPRWPALMFGGVVKEMSGSLALDVMKHAWPAGFMVSGALAVAVAILLIRGGRLAALVAPLVILDLLVAGEGINPWTDRSFYALQPAARSLIDSVPPGPHRWFAYGFVNAPGVKVAPQVLAQNRDTWLYYFDRQTLLPRMQVLDGLEGALDEDRVGWASAGSTLTASERTPARYRETHGRVRAAGVRYVLSLLPIDDPHLEARGAAPIAQLAEPLRLYELKDALPRAFFVPRAVQATALDIARRIEDPAFDPTSVVLLETDPSAPSSGPATAAPPSVRYTRIDAHTTQIATDTEAGFIVVLDNYDTNWIAESNGHPVPLLRANGQAMALKTQGGSQTVTLRYRPRWRERARFGVALGLFGLALLWLNGLRRVGRGARRWRSPGDPLQ